MDIKSSILLWLVLLATTLCSCTDRKASSLLPELTHVEALMYTHPDSALHILQRMQPPASSDKLQNATWCLFMTQAWDKNYKKFTSDSLISIAYDYFIKQDDPQRRALAANYKGVVSAHMGDTEKAMHYYLEAAKEVEKTEDYQLAHLIQARLGMIYLYRSLDEYAMSAFQKAYQFAKLSEDNIYVSSSLSCIARVYTIQYNWDKAIEYYIKAMDAAEKVNNMRSYSGALGELSGIYTRKKEYNTALICAKKSLSIKEKNQLPTEQSLLDIGDTYRLIGKRDSATYYLHKAKLSDNIRTARAAYQSLYFLTKKENDYKKAIAYSDMYWLYTDSIQKTDRRREVIEMQEKYNQEKILNEKNILKIEKERTVRNALIILVFLLCIIAILIYVFQRKLIKKQRKIQQNELKIRQYMMKIHENESLINRNENRMEELASQIEENQEVQGQLEEQQAILAEMQLQNKKLREENQVFQENIHTYSTSLHEKNKEIDAFKELSEENQRLQAREKFLSAQLFKKTEVLNALKVSPKMLDAIRWEEVREDIDYLYENYTQRLRKEFPSLTETDMQVCCLLKLHLTNDDMATLLGISSSSVSKRKQRLKERIMQELEKPFDANQTLDSWLWEY